MTGELQAKIEQILGAPIEWVIDEDALLLSDDIVTSTAQLHAMEGHTDPHARVKAVLTVAVTCDWCGLLDLPGATDRPWLSDDAAVWLAHHVAESHGVRYGAGKAAGR